MLEHHKESLENLKKYFANDPEIISIILGGSVAKGCERPDSDIDAIIVVQDSKYAALEKENRLTECVFGHCTYENGYFDIKYTTIKYLRLLAEKGSEPSRNAFLSAKCVFGDDKEIIDLIEKIPVFQKSEKQEKMLSFFSALCLNYKYFWTMSGDNTYLRMRAASDIVLFGLRLVLQNNEVLFPCHKALLATIAGLEKKPDQILEKTENLLRTLTDEAKDEFVNSIFAFIEKIPTKDYNEILTRYTDDNELWWYKQRPNIAEW